MEVLGTNQLSHSKSLEDFREALRLPKSLPVIERPPPEMCLTCRGTKFLCGKARCPIIVKAEPLARTDSRLKSEYIDGSTPPSVFVGRFGYPKVYLGPMLPPFHGNTSILDTPEMWFGKSIDTIIDYRYSLIRGNARVNISDAGTEGRLIEKMQELAMASRPTDMEVQLTKRPSRKLVLSEDSEPFGPVAPLRSFKTSTITVDYRIEEAYYDRDLKTRDALERLYNNGVLVTSIQRAFSTGNLGIGKQRRMVPTRWSITTVDDTLSSALIREIKSYPTIDDFRVYYLKNLDNIYVTLLLPQPWKFEWIEAWFPNTMWNQWSQKIAIMGDHEEYWGRNTYASVGGCYYATRLSVTEALRRERHQAKSILLREIHPGYIMPVGVWNVRESVREQLRQRPASFDNIQDAVKFAFSKLTVSSREWLANSSLLNEALFQKHITDFR